MYDVIILISIQFELYAARRMPLYRLLVKQTLKYVDVIFGLLRLLPVYVCQKVYSHWMNIAVALPSCIIDAAVGVIIIHWKYATFKPRSS